jgi:hypothetical protein
MKKFTFPNLVMGQVLNDQFENAIKEGRGREPSDELAEKLKCG